jgi:flavin reductase (DIM6/NTAB) family NADH-FMN oxidoreductase RutF
MPSAGSTGNALLRTAPVLPNAKAKTEICNLIYPYLPLANKQGVNIILNSSQALTTAKKCIKKKGNTIMEKVDYMEVAQKVMAQIRNKGGAFLTAQVGDDINTMTIGWASLGFLWGRPMLTVMVRKTRHTFGIIERAKDFTVSVPLSGMAKQLEFCGTKSGRNHKKIEECGLEIMPSIKVHTPVILVPGIQFECRIVYKSAVEPASLIEEYTHLYPEKDFHTLYFGEIKECYSTKDEKIK